MALLPETGREEAQAMMERIEKDMSERTWSNEAVRVLVDSGIATCPPDGTDVDSLIRLADFRLYEQKRKRKLLRAQETGEK